MVEWSKELYVNPNTLSSLSQEKTADDSSGEGKEVGKEVSPSLDRHSTQLLAGQDNHKQLQVIRFIFTMMNRYISNMQK